MRTFSSLGQPFAHKLNSLSLATSYRTLDKKRIPVPTENRNAGTSAHWRWALHWPLTQAWVDEKKGADALHDSSPRASTYNHTCQTPSGYHFYPTFHNSDTRV
jgi:hypothetical protein